MRTKKKQESKGTLSFNMDDDEEEEEEEEEKEEEEEENGREQCKCLKFSGWSVCVCCVISAPPPTKRRKFAKFGKDPRVDTSFLPDRDREVSNCLFICLSVCLSVCLACVHHVVFSRWCVGGGEE